jgi:cell division cycle 20-like protein 1 (cofactor of APC complex)
MFFFYRSEVLNDPHAYTNFMESEAAIANNQVRTPRRLYHYTSPREEHRTLPQNSSNSISNYTIADDTSSSGEGHNSNDDSNDNNDNSNSNSNSNSNNNSSSDNSNNNNNNNINNNSIGNNIHSDLNGRNITGLLRSVDESNDFFSPPTPSVRYRPSPVSDAGLRILGAHQYPSRFINRTAIKILDAPELEDDFYLNLVDWGPNDCLAVGLGNCVYLWDANTSRVMKLCEFPTERISSVCWAQQGKHLAIGTNGANMQLWDVKASKRLRTWQNHKGRVSSLAWNMNILTSGSKDHHIFHHDIRSPMPYFRDMNVHHQEVCGLKWSLDGSMLASGGNDNKLMIWSSHENLVMHKFSEHTAAVKAIAWCPYDRSLLVSGGGTADKSIKFWNAQRGALLDSFDTGSQVCNVVWSKRSKEIVSTHGYANQHANASNQVVVWNAKTMNRVATLTGHTSRVLFMSMDSNGSTVVTGAGDETLRFWDVFGSVDPQRKGVDRAVILR